MLFPYKYIEHDISFLQKWMDHLFMNVWCNADKEYDFDVLDGCQDLKKLVKAEYYKEDPNTKHKDYISGPIRNIYEEFRKIDKIERKKIKKWYKRTRNINKTCQGQKLYKPLNLKTIAKISTNLEKLLKDFYGNLYDNILGLVAVKNTTGTLSDHYKEFVKVNNAGICPFCGIATLRSYEMDGHEAYDHYLPISHFPFTAVSFRNLAPTCHSCNSTNKNQNPVIFDTNGLRRKVFYPYSSTLPEIKLTIKTSISDYKNFQHKDIAITFSSNNCKQETETWKDVYKIEKRYKDLLCNEGEGKYWLLQYIEEMNASERLKEKSKFEKRLKESKYKNQNFLKIPFLLAVEENGVI